MKKDFFAVLVFVVSNGLAFAGETPAKPTLPKQLEQMKRMAGQWKAKSKGHDGKEETSTVSYEVTSGGSAIVEKLFAGTDHEMVSVYHAAGSKIAMTHYCMMGNSPELTLKKSDDKTLVFELDGTKGIQSKSEPHMHGLTLTWIDNDHVTQEWSSYAHGKKGESTVITLTRD